MDFLDLVAIFNAAIIAETSSFDGNVIKGKGSSTETAIWDTFGLLEETSDTENFNIKFALISRHLQRINKHCRKK